MSLNLDSMCGEIKKHVEARGMALFRAFPRAGEPASQVYWDTERCPDFREFLAAAEAAGVRMVALHAREFTDDMVEDALDRLEDSGLPREERRAIEMRLKETLGYTGFTCQIEISFDVAPRVYVFDLRTEWFDDLNEMLDRIDDTPQEPDEEPLGGEYFSKN